MLAAFGFNAEDDEDLTFASVFTTTALNTISTWHSRHMTTVVFAAYAKADAPSHHCSHHRRSADMASAW